MKHPLHSSILLAAFALPVFAQQRSADTATRAQGPILEVQTSRPEVATEMATNFGHTEALPELPSGSHYVLALDGQGKIAVKTDPGDVGLVRLNADPSALLDLFSEQIEGAKAMVRGPLTMILASNGIAAKDIAQFTEEVFAFPRQLQSVSLKVVGDPEHIPKSGLDIDFAMVPKTGTVFATLVDALQPCSKGVPIAPGDREGAMQIQMSFAPETIQKVFAPLNDFFVKMALKDPEQRQLARAQFDRYMKLEDGGISATFRAGSHAHMLVGVLDAEAAQKLLASDEYLKMAQSMNGAGHMQVEVKPNALQHRNVQVVKLHMTSDGPPNPLMPDGSLEAHSFAAGPYMIATFGGKETDVKSLIDTVLDDKMQRAPLANGGLFQVAVDIKAMMAVMDSTGSGKSPNENTPAKFNLLIGKGEHALQAHVHVQ